MTINLDVNFEAMMKFSSINIFYTTSNHENVQIFKSTYSGHVGRYKLYCKKACEMNVLIFISGNQSFSVFVL